MLARAIAGLALAGGIVLLARRTRSLSPGGAAAALVVGTVSIAAGWQWGIVLVAFFTSSSVLSRWREETKTCRTDGIAAKGGERDAVQVLANGGLFSVCALLSMILPWRGWPLLATGAIAAAAADTWATEIGSLAPNPPRSIVGWQPVPTGTSGAISAWGTLAALAGATFIGIIAWSVRWPTLVLPAAIAGGFAGSTADSLVGAKLQARHWCERCDQSTERLVHRCGSATRHAGGLRWLGNDAVNVLCGIVGALVAGIFLR